MPITTVSLILPRAPDIVTVIISDFLVADLTLSQACEWSPLGSTFLLDLVWMRSLRDAQTSKWTFAKLLQSERSYYRWAFSQSLVQTVRRGDLTMLQWLLSHFSGCPVSQEVVEEAARGGHLWALQLLERDTSHAGIEWSDRAVDRAAKIGDWELVRWLLQRTGSTRETRRADDEVVNSAFEQNNLLQVKWAIGCGFGVGGIQFPDCTEAEWQGRAEILRYLLDGGHVPVANIAGVGAYQAARFGDLYFLKWLEYQLKAEIDVQYWTHALENASESGYLAVVQWILTHADGVVRANGPADAMFAAAENGKLDVVHWLYKHYGSKPKVGLFQERDVPDGTGNDEEHFWDEDLVPTTAMDAAAKNGHLAVLQFLDSIDTSSRNKQKKRGGKLSHNRQVGRYPRCTSFAMDAAAACGHLHVVKWLHSHRLEGCTTLAMDRAAGNGHFEVVQWLHVHRSEGCTTAAMDIAATRRFHVSSCDGFGFDVCCLHITPKSFFENQLEMLKWLHLNRSEGSSSAAMDGAAANGNFEMLQWLLENCTAGCTTESIVSAARLGRLDIVKWLDQHYPNVHTLKAMSEAASVGHFNVVKWIYEQHTPGHQTVAESMKEAAAGGHTRLVKWLLPHCTKPSSLLSAMKAALSSHSFEAMLLLDAQLVNHYTDGDLRNHWFRYQDIRNWFDEKYSPSAEGE
ncbi:hypothetical protein L917_19803 [Phytophthora nicotianae]|uniref:Uncharacterized protein n=1 Tax=Phytophthora nicotianae TaxID=4792 RepID=W2K3A0_PHYNI|nr:hypothetical protein L917_19803 [Phytophthora nicotianae]ETM32847.1 hypothetical protein L914_19838 [Phytophthora nicotianae]